MIPVMALSLSLATSLTSLNKPVFAKDKMTIWLWGGASDKPTWSLFKKVVTDFNKTNKFGVEFDFSITENANYKTKIETAMASGKTPDMFETWPAGILKGYVDAGRLYSFESEFQKDSEWKKRFPAGFPVDCKVGGKAYAAPNVSSLGCLYYNKALFKKYKVALPKTTDDLLAAAKTFRKNGVNPIALGEKDAWTGAFLSELIINRVGGNAPFNNVVAGKGKWTDPAFIKAGKYMQQLVDAKAFPNGFMALSYDNGTAMFKRGDAAMYFMGTWVGGGFCEKGSPIAKSVGVITFPTFPGGAGDVNTWLGAPDNCISISKTAKNKKACVALLKAFSDPKYQKQLAEDSGSIPATSVKLNPAKSNDVMNDVLALTANMKSMFSAFDVALGQDIGGQYNNTIQAILGGDDVKKSFEKLQTYMDSKK